VPRWGAHPDTQGQDPFQKRFRSFETSSSPWSRSATGPHPSGARKPPPLPFPLPA